MTVRLTWNCRGHEDAAPYVETMDIDKLADRLAEVLKHNIVTYFLVKVEK